MSDQPNRIQRLISSFPRSAAAAYVVAVLLLGAGAWSAIADILDRRADVAASQAILDRLEGRNVSSRTGGIAAAMSGSPLLEGPTVTVAGATLLQRVT